MGKHGAIAPAFLLSAEDRSRIEGAIERLIALLDAADGDEREPDADFEPSLGWSLDGWPQALSFAEADDEVMG